MRSREQLLTLIEAVGHPMALLDDRSRIQGANEAFLHYLGAASEQVTGISIFDAANGRFDTPMLRDLLRRAGQQSAPLEDVMLNVLPETQGRAWVSRAKRLATDDAGYWLALGLDTVADTIES